ncbi:MAG: AAA-like domain-containing protein [Scytonema sp. PMC 1069.18]|nr:AAA-like domain-containing protein [Scytonema sp. PMC 1069.18]MEC4881046.1 AAA-like domain-containing protein [Scytonema sp. PMC 1070.18]
MAATTSNFYQVGASLPVDAPSYVKRVADEEFYQKLKAGKFCYVLNSRQMGKSSLRVQTMQRLLASGIVCAAIDLTGIGKHKVTIEQWYGGIVYALVESCQLEDKFDFDWQTWWLKHQEVFDSVTCLRLFIEKVLLDLIEQQIVIFVDEIDRVLSQDFSLDDFFALIRFFQNQRVDNPVFERLTFALLGVATPSNLITDKTQTPFNIGEAIELHGFQLDEAQPLIKGLSHKFSRPQEVMKDILHWTGGQPFLTQKLCQFMVEESTQENPRTVEQVVLRRIIENWESQDEPEHLRTIRDRILRDEQRAGYLLELYQQIRQEQKTEVTADDTLEQSELQLSGLVVRQQNKLRVYNPIYKEIFDQSWIETQLRNLRPYSESFRFWVASGGTDESRLLRGKALQDALEWSKGKSLNYQDREFLAASVAKEKEQAIAALEKEAQLERERKDREAVEKRNLILGEANQVLIEANQKAQHKIRVGTVFFSVTLVAAAIFGGVAVYSVNKVIEARNELQKIDRYIVDVQQIYELSKKISEKGFSDQASEIRRLAKESEKIQDIRLNQALLHASKSLAYQYLENWDDAELYIKNSQKLLLETEENIELNVKYSKEKLQIKLLALNIQAQIFQHKNNTQLARKAYQDAFDLLQSNSNHLNPFNTNTQIISTTTVELVHRGLIELLPIESSQGNEKLSKSRFYNEKLSKSRLKLRIVKESLK